MEQLQIFKNKKLYIYTFILILLIFLVTFNLYNQKKQENTPKNAILEILDKNKDLGEKWRETNAEVEILQEKLKELLDSKTMIEDQMKHNREIIDYKIKVIENPDYTEELPLWPIEQILNWDLEKENVF